MKLAVPQFVKNQPVRTFALVCVAVTSAFVMYVRYWELEILSSPDWCNRAMKAEQLAEGSRLDAALACVGLQTIQIKAIANNSYIDGGTIALCLLALMVIVVAGGHLSVATKLGSVNVGRDKVEEAVEHVVERAQEGAAEAKAGIAPAPKPDDPNIPDYAR